MLHPQVPLDSVSLDLLQPVEDADMQCNGTPPAQAAASEERCHRAQQVSVQQQCLGQCVQTLASVESVLHAPVAGATQLGIWRRELQALRKANASPSYSVVVVGDTGSGKSTLLNALLGETAVLPTNGMRACTAAIVELAHTRPPDAPGQYYADVDFMSESEWNKELDICFGDLQMQSGKIMARRPQAQGPAQQSWERLRAVYGRVCSTREETVGQRGRIAQALGTTRSLHAATAESIRRKIERYVDSRNSADTQAFWPIVKRVRCRGPWDVLSSGAVLVDAPGVRDDNSARDAVVQTYIKQVSALLCVCVFWGVPEPAGVV